MKKVIESYDEFYTKIYNIIRNFSKKVFTGTNESLELEFVNKEIKENEEFRIIIKELLYNLSKERNKRIFADNEQLTRRVLYNMDMDIVVHDFLNI